MEEMKELIIHKLELPEDVKINIIVMSRDGRGCIALLEFDDRYLVQVTPTGETTVKVEAYRYAFEK